MSAPAPARSSVRVRLVPLVVEHLPFVMTWVNDREVMQYFALRQERISEDEERGYLAKLIASSTDRAFSIFEGGDDGDDDDASYIGQCSINQIYWPARNGRVFLVVRKEKQHGGRGAAALEALVNISFAEPSAKTEPSAKSEKPVPSALDLHKLWLIVRRDNRKAQAMYLRAGFEFEGVLRDEYCVAGRYFDMVRMGILRGQSQQQ